MRGRSGYGWSSYSRLLLWMFGEAIVGIFSYGFSAYMPDFAIVLVLIVALIVIWYDPDFPKRTTKSYITLLFWLPVILGLFCGILWRTSGKDVWMRLGFACICVRAAYRIMGRVTSH